MADAVDIRVEDYREARGSFDAIVAVEMIEAVGEEYWPTYFRALDRLLAQGGTVAIQAILMSHDRYLVTRRSYGWIQKHIFPGGLIPSLQAVSEVTERETELRLTRVHTFGQDYAETLRRWRETFLRAGRLCSARLRRDVPAQVGVLPGLLRGRLRLRLPRRGPAAFRAGSMSAGMRGRKVWVVGASSGIGAELARELFRRGAEVAISGRRPAELDRGLPRQDGDRPRRRHGRRCGGRGGRCSA